MSLFTSLVGYWDLSEASGTRSDSTAYADTMTDVNTVTGPTGPGSHNVMRCDLLHRGHPGFQEDGVGQKFRHLLPPLPCFPVEDGGDVVPVDGGVDLAA